MRHFDGNGTTPSGPSQGNVGVSGKNGRAEQAGQWRDVSQLRIDLLAADHRHGHDRRTGAQGDLHKAAAAEALEPVALGERLARALHALGEDRNQLILFE